MNYEGIERRNFLRVGYDHSIKVSAIDGNELKTIDSCQSKNISSSGLMFVARSQFPIGTLLAVHLNLSLLSNLFEIESNVIFQSGYTLARLVRLEEHPEKDRFFLGVCFLCEKTPLEEDEKELLLLLKEEESSS